MPYFDEFFFEGILRSFCHGLFLFKNVIDLPANRCNCSSNRVHISLLGRLVKIFPLCSVRIKNNYSLRILSFKLKKALKLPI
jgi:hypothetical protein